MDTGSVFDLTVGGHRTQERQKAGTAFIHGGSVKRHFMNQWTFSWSEWIWKLAAKDIPFIWVEGDHLSKMIWHGLVIFKWYGSQIFTNYCIAFRFFISYQFSSSHTSGQRWEGSIFLSFHVALSQEALSVGGRTKQRSRDRAAECARFPERPTFCSVLLNQRVYLLSLSFLWSMTWVKGI